MYIAVARAQKGVKIWRTCQLNLQEYLVKNWSFAIWDAILTIVLRSNLEFFHLTERLFGFVDEFWAFNCERLELTVYFDNNAIFSHTVMNIKAKNSVILKNARICK